MSGRKDASPLRKSGRGHRSQTAEANCFGTDSQRASRDGKQHPVADALSPEPRPATDTEPRLQPPVFFSILDRRPEEQAEDEYDGQEHQDDDEDHGGDAHANNDSRARLI